MTRKRKLSYQTDGSAINELCFICGIKQNNVQLYEMTHMQFIYIKYIILYIVKPYTVLSPNFLQ